jgi:hypothetical protein
MLRCIILVESNRLPVFPLPMKLLMATVIMFESQFSMYKFSLFKFALGSRYG